MFPKAKPSAPPEPSSVFEALRRWLFDSGAMLIGDAHVNSAIFSQQQTWRLPSGLVASIAESPVATSLALEVESSLTASPEELIAILDNAEAKGRLMAMQHEISKKTLDRLIAHGALAKQSASKLIENFVIEGLARLEIGSRPAAQPESSAVG